MRARQVPEIKMAFMARLRGIAAVCAMTGFVGGAALAAAPQLKTQAPGYYRMMLGDFEITALSDGTFSMHANELLTNSTPKKIDADLARSFLSDPSELSVNAFLINTGSKLVLVDTGSGTYYGPTLGKLIASLKASGYQPEQVDEVYITHMHPDHIGGLVTDGKPTFPNATVRAAQQDADYWLSKEKMEAAPKEAKNSFEDAMKSLTPYVNAGKFKPFDGATALVPGVRAVPAPGHTPGHTLYEISSKGETLVLWGDLMHVASIQFGDPAVTIRFDTDSPAAAAERKKEFAQAAQKGYWLGVAHISFPGIGHLRTSGAGYSFVPANYTSLPMTK
jgi:glyoxylase-like metal-dependent hydrolase (beta-lactamase superfamily II)